MLLNQTNCPAGILKPSKFELMLLELLGDDTVACNAATIGLNDATSTGFSAVCDEDSETGAKPPVLNGFTAEV